MKKFPIAVFIPVFLLSLGAALSAPADPIDLQGLIDSAAPGEVVRVPAGIYRGNFELKPGVILAGEGAKTTVLDGAGAGPVITATGGGVIKGLTIRNGVEGIKSGPGLIGVFDCIVASNKGDGIRCAPGNCVLVNNIIESPVALSVARAHALAVNNTISGEEEGIRLWKASEVNAVNNIILESRLGIKIETDSEPVFDNNIFWNNGFLGLDQPKNNLTFDPGVIRDEDGFYRLSAAAPARTSGMAVAGVPERITAACGSSLPETLTLEESLELMEQTADELLEAGPIVTYRLLDEAGYFEVKTRFARPDFTVTSSSENTPISEVEAYDFQEGEALNKRLVYDEPPAVEVSGWGGNDYERETDRYQMEGVFYKPEAYRIDENGDCYFTRKSNFARIEIEIPKGYRVSSLVPETEIEPGADIISISNPDQSLLTIDLVLSPDLIYE